MEIKIIKQINIYVLLSLSISFNVQTYANEDFNLSQNKLKSESAENKLFNKDLNHKDPLKDLSIDLSKILHHSNNTKFEKNIEKLDFNSSELAMRNELILNKNEYFLIKTKDNNKLMFNGSLIIKFDDLSNFQDYAANNQLIFIKDLSDINAAIFKVNNFLDLKIILGNLKKDPAVKSIELNTINLNLEPK